MSEGVEQVAREAANLHLDDVTGEKVSKSELKKRQKAREKEARKEDQKAQQAKQQAANAAAQEDTAIGCYGALPNGEIPENVMDLKGINEEFVDREVTVVAKIHNSRSQSAKMAFLVLRDELRTIQALVSADGKAVSKQMVKWCVSVNNNSIVQVSGTVKKTDVPVKSTSMPGLEMHVSRMFLLEKAIEKLPMQIKDAELPLPSAAEEELEGAAPSLKTRLDNRVLDLQTPLGQAITEILSTTKSLFHEYMTNAGSTWIDTPKLLGAATEGGSGVFEVSNYFGKKAYLAQSPQLYKQMMIAAGRPCVHEISPVFRAENSNTHRHLTEFTGLDYEKVFNNHYHEVLSFGEGLVIRILKDLQQRCQEEISIIQKVYPKAGDFRLPEDGRALRLEYLEGVRMLKEAGEDTTEQDKFENDLTTAMEKKLGDLIRQKYNTDFYVLDHFPLALRPFYTKQSPEDANLSNSYDFFMRGEEIMSGAQRINDADELEAAMRKKGLDPESDGFVDYVNAFRYGCRKHAGGGLGLNRIVMFFLGLPNIRMTTLFPRDPQRLRP